MNLIFELSKEGHGCSILPPCDVPVNSIPKHIERRSSLHLPQMAEVDINRHYTALAKRTHAVNDGFYPLGSCTMKYNPRINEEVAGKQGFTGIHPLQPVETAQGCLEVLHTAKLLLCEITGMQDMTFQPSAGAHGEFLGLLLIKAYHTSRSDWKRKKIIVPDSSHGTNPASATMCGYEIINVPSTEDGCVDMDKLKEVVGEDTAGLMLTNPNTLGIFDKNILEITSIIHGVGGLCYYDGANLNAIMGITRPGDMGFDVIHLNLHKTFSTPHGGGGPGSGPVGCNSLLAPFLPKFTTEMVNGQYHFKNPTQSIGCVKSFYGNFLVVLRALTYLLTLGADGIKEVAQNAVLNANYLKCRLSESYDIAYQGLCMHEFVITLENLKKEKGVSAMDIAKSLLDYGIHPPTMYFPLIVHEALMFEPTETESKETLDAAADTLLSIYEEALHTPDKLHEAPISTPVRRLDEVNAARNPKLRYEFHT